MIFIFNGPPGSGKDEAALYMKEHGFLHLSFKSELIKETVRYYGVNYTWFLENYDNRKVKERPEKALNGLSRRQALIHVSENVIKPSRGADYFGRCVSEKIKSGVDYSISDGGFIEELVPLINKVGLNNIVLIQLTRKGCDFSKDSRRYFHGNLVKEIILGHSVKINKKHVLNNDYNVKTYRVHNNGTLEDFRDALQKIYKIEKATHETEEG